MEPLEAFSELESKLGPDSRTLVSLLRGIFEQQQRALEELRQVNQQQSESTQATQPLQRTIEELHKTIEQLRADNAELKRLLFGRKSERLKGGKMPPIESEVRRIVEMEEYFGIDADGSEKQVSQSSPEKSSEQPLAKPNERRKRGRKKSEKQRKKRRLARKKLPVVRKRILVTQEQLPDGYTLQDFRPVGAEGNGEVIRRLEHVREHLVMTEYELQTLASKDGDHIVKASSPPAVTDGGQYGPGVYAHVVTAKCADSLPLHRIEKIFDRNGYAIARSTLCCLFHRSAELMTPIGNRLIELAAQDPYLNMDETPQPVLDKGGCRRGWIWTLVTQQLIAYKFSPTRASETPKTILNGSAGFLQTDDYAGYNSSTREGRTPVRCWGHTRRKYFSALQTAPEEAKTVLDMIIKLYRVEYLAAERQILSTDAHLYLRKSESKAVLDEMNKWLKAQQPLHPPKSPIGKAIAYTQNNWDALNEFVNDPKLPLDNNIAENALRIFALGRKNFLFVGHELAGENLAVLQSIVSTCKLHKVNPYEYLKDVLIRVATHPSKRLDELLPQNWKPPPTAQDPPENPA
jgi:transposase